MNPFWLTFIILKLKETKINDAQEIYQTSLKEGAPRPNFPPLFFIKASHILSLDLDFLLLDISEMINPSYNLLMLMDNNFKSESYLQIEIINRLNFKVKSQE